MSPLRGETSMVISQRELSERLEKANGATPPSGNGLAAASNGSFVGVTGGLGPFAYALEASAPVQYAAGTVRWATAQQLPTLRGIAINAERLHPGSVRELHWHVNAHELGYC